MSYIFDLTDSMQASVRFGTKCHPDGKSLGIFIGLPYVGVENAPKDEKGNPRALDYNAYDAVDWERAVRFAKWILSFEEERPEEEE